MGGCCSSRRGQFHGTPAFYYRSSATEEHESLTSNYDSAATDFHDDLNLDTSLPNTYRSPPTPIPFDVVLGRRPQPTCTNSAGETSGSATDLKESSFKPDDTVFLHASASSGLLKSTPDHNPNSSLATDEEAEADVCPTCLEDYDEQNPRIVTKCRHHFHLSCILEWSERSDRCPICDRVMSYQV